MLGEEFAWRIGSGLRTYPVIVPDAVPTAAALRLLSMHGSHTESIGEWWGSGRYETMVRRAVPRAASDGDLPTVVPSIFPDAEQFTEAAAGHPDLLDDDTLSWLTCVVFKEGSLLRSARLPSTAAVTLPDWAVQDLLDLRPPEDETTEAPETRGE
ncbi:hypothetical protein ACFWR4_36985 [Streptomyces hydrogenans]|uniref:hypothetical protein n=1 Tax=Streptomyces hydrogenans TaxID=1873719 RepID=UPI0036627404